MKRTHSEAIEDVAGSTPGEQSMSPATSPIDKRSRGSASPPAALNPSSVQPPPPVSSIFTDASGRMRVPTISRKVRACAACKKQKIRCDFEEGANTCVRCKKMKLECVVNRSLQTILDEDVEWKQRMREDTNQLQKAVEDVLNAMSMRPLGSYQHASPMGSRDSSEPPSVKIPTGLQPAVRPQPDFSDNTRTYPQFDSEATRWSNRVMKREPSPEPQLQDAEGNLVSNAMGSVYELTRLRGLRSSASFQQTNAPDPEGDFISRGIISMGDAQELFAFFRTKLNAYLYSIAIPYNDVESTRLSTMLSSAVFTVSALHLPAYHHVFPVLYEHLLHQISSTLFGRHEQTDDVRGLCIASFWLHDIAWKLCGYAARIGTELNLHHSFRKALRGSGDCHERARLWYLLYVCDHHFSLAYGRPPLIHDSEQVKKYDLFLQSPLAAEGDRRVLSQVSLLTVLTKAYLYYEDEADEEIPDERLVQLHLFNQQLGAWRTKWGGQLQNNDVVGDYPGKGVDLHYNFAKLQVNAVVLRGISELTEQNLSPLRREHANMAVTSATAVLTYVLNEPSIRDSLIGVPLYINTMIAFAAVFILKVSAKWRDIDFGITPNQARSLVEQVVELLNSRGASKDHILPHIAAGLERMIIKCAELERRDSPLDENKLWEVSMDSAGSAAIPRYPCGIPPHMMPVHADGPPGGGGLTYNSGNAPQWPGYPIGHQTGPVRAPDGTLVYQQAPPVPPNVPGAQGVYDVNGQYFPMHMGAFDFLSPQLRY